MPTRVRPHAKPNSSKRRIRSSLSLPCFLYPRIVPTHLPRPAYSFDSIGTRQSPCVRWYSARAAYFDSQASAHVSFKAPSHAKPNSSSRRIRSSLSVPRLLNLRILLTQWPRLGGSLKRGGTRQWPWILWYSTKAAYFDSHASPVPVQTNPILSSRSRRSCGRAFSFRKCRCRPTHVASRGFSGQ